MSADGAGDAPLDPVRREGRQPGLLHRARGLRHGLPGVGPQARLQGAEILPGADRATRMSSTTVKFIRRWSGTLSRSKSVGLTTIPVNAVRAAASPAGSESAVDPAPGARFGNPGQRGPGEVRRRDEVAAQRLRQRSDQRNSEICSQAGDLALEGGRVDPGQHGQRDRHGHPVVAAARVEDVAQFEVDAARGEPVGKGRGIETLGAGGDQHLGGERHQVGGGSGRPSSTRSRSAVRR